MGDDHRDRKLDALSAMHRARVREPQALGLLVRDAEYGVLRAQQERPSLVV